MSGRPKVELDLLTPREREVVGLVREGLTNEQIAQRLRISVAGVKYHVSEVLSKLALENRHDIVRWAASAPEERRPWWYAALAPLRLLWRPASSSGPTLAAALAALLALAIIVGLGFLMYGLIESDRSPAAALLDDDNPELPVVYGDRLAISSLDGAPPVELAGPGDYSGVRYGPDGRLLFARRVGKEPGFYRVEDGSPRLVIPLEQPFFGANQSEWAPDGSAAAWIREDGDEWVLQVAEPGGAPRTVGLPGPFAFRWSPDGRHILTWGSREEDEALLIDPTGSQDPVPTGMTAVRDWSSRGDVAFLEVSSDTASIAVADQNGENPRTISRAVGGPVEFSPNGRWLAWSTALDEDAPQAQVQAGDDEERGVRVASVDGPERVMPRCPACSEGSAGREPAWSPDGGRLAWTQDGQVVVAEVGVWEGRPVAEGTFAMWSPDSERLAYHRVAYRTEQGELSSGRTLFVAQADGVNETRVVELPSPVGLRDQVAWSPDGDRLVVSLQIGEQRTATALDPRTGETEDLPLPARGDCCYSPFLAPDGSAVIHEDEATGLAPDGSAVIHEDEAPREVLLITSDGEERTVPVEAGTAATDWSADATSALFVGSGRLASLDVNSMATQTLLDGNVQDAVWSPDETRIAFIGDQRLGVLDAGTGEAESIVPDLDAMPRRDQYGRGHLAWSPDGTTIAFGSWSGEERSDVYVVNEDGSGLRRLTDSPGAKQHFSWSPDGAHLAYRSASGGAPHIRVIAVSSGEPLPIDEQTRLAGVFTWVGPDALLADARWGISLIRTDGDVRPIVPATRPCGVFLIGWADGRLFFERFCNRLGGIV